MNVGLVVSKDALGFKIPKAAMGKTISEGQKAGVSQCKTVAFERDVAKDRRNEVSDGMVDNLLFGSVMVKGKAFSTMDRKYRMTQERNQFSLFM